MKIILNDTPDSAINIKDITDEHIVVGCINTEPVIITREKFNNGDYVGMSINDKILRGNNWQKDFKSVGDFVGYYLNLYSRNGNKFEAFHQSDWKKAMQWLMDNCD